MKIGVVTFPGSNCNMDMVNALSNDLEYEVVELWHKHTDLQGVDAVVLPGGFSYGDYLRSGAIARFSNIMEQVVKFADNGGKVLGICNGFQILCEASLLPGTLMHNESRKFICKNVELVPVSRTASLTAGLSTTETLTIPIAHGEGNYFLPEDQLAELEANDQVLFRYCDENGKVSTASNPNGAVNNIAGVCNVKKNVFGMMPHPERACSDDLGNTDGVNILRGLIEELIISE
jgi:phosphoribosylformylglycinamidine synthase